jgi:hypothetical protein
MSTYSHARPGMPHWVYGLARYWVRTQLTMASAVVVGLTSISLGLNPIPRTIPLQELINRYPGPAFGLGSALVVVSALAFVLARRPEPGALAEAGVEAPLSAAAPVSPLQPGGWSGPVGQPPTVPPATQPDIPTRPARTRSSRWGVIAVVVLLLLSLGILGTGGVLAYTSTQGLLQAPARTIAAYCADLTHADPTRTDDPHYGDAFHLLSIAAQRQVSDSAASYEHVAHLSDVLDGSARQCSMTAGGSGVVVENNTAHAALRIVRNKTYGGNIHLVYEQNTWRIDRLDAALQGTDVAPLAAAEDMCNAFVARNYGMAYDDLSASAQQSFGSVDVLAQAAQSGGDENTNVTFYQCGTQYGTYTPTGAGNPPSVVITMTLRATGTGSSSGKCTDITFDWGFTMLRVAGAWKVDNLDIGTTEAAPPTDCSSASA